MQIVRRIRWNVLAGVAVAGFGVLLLIAPDVALGIAPLVLVPACLITTIVILERTQM